MEARNQSSAESTLQTFRLVDDNPSKASFGLSFLDTPQNQTPLTPPPPCIEVTSSQVSSNVKYSVETVNIDGLTLLKGRVSTEEVFSLSNSDLVPGKYEGGLKLWEGSLDLVKALRSEIQDERLSFTGKRVLELGCGHGLPGIFACLKGATTIHFQDFNAEVLQHLTIPNVNANIKNKSQPSDIIDISQINPTAEIRFFSGDWNEVDQILSPGSYDVILMAETVYSNSVLSILYNLIKKCITASDGVVYMAAKKHYFGVGGGSRRFISVVEKDGLLGASLVSEITDGSSNVREVWKLYFK